MKFNTLMIKYFFDYLYILIIIHNKMAFKVFKQMGKDVIINIENIVYIKVDDVSKKSVVYSTTLINEVDESLEEIEVMLGIGPKKITGNLFKL